MQHIKREYRIFHIIINLPKKFLSICKPFSNCFHAYWHNRGWREIIWGNFYAELKLCKLHIKQNLQLN